MHGGLNNMFDKIEEDLVKIVQGLEKKFFVSYPSDISLVWRE